MYSARLIFHNNRQRRSEKTNEQSNYSTIHSSVQTKDVLTSQNTKSFYTLVFLKPLPSIINLLCWIIEFCTCCRARGSPIFSTTNTLSTTKTSLTNCHVLILKYLASVSIYSLSSTTNYSNFFNYIRFVFMCYCKVKLIN